MAMAPTKAEQVILYSVQYLIYDLNNEEKAQSTSNANELNEMRSLRGLCETDSILFKQNQQNTHYFDSRGTHRGAAMSASWHSYRRSDAKVTL
jgi:hypothetical protein